MIDTSSQTIPGNGGVNSAKPAEAAGDPLARSARAHLTLDDLAGMTTQQLIELYTQGSVPASLTALDGEPTCRMLTVRGIDRGPAFGAIRHFAASTRFPWLGKAFQAKSDTEGSGINRVRLLGDHRWYPFATRTEASALDGQPCVVLDYDKPENPPFIRVIRDELREITPGLFFGPALLDDKKKPARLVLFFACDHR